MSATMEKKKKKISWKLKLRNSKWITVYRKANLSGSYLHERFRILFREAFIHFIGFISFSLNK